MRTTVLIPLANVSELRYVDTVRTLVRTTVLLLHLYQYSNLCSICVIMKRIFCLRRIYEKTHSKLFIPGIIMLGIVLRTPFTTLPTVLSDIAAGLGVDVSSLGLLTSLPLLTFAISLLLRFNLLKVGD